MKPRLTTLQLSALRVGLHNRFFVAGKGQAVDKRTANCLHKRGLLARSWDKGGSGSIAGWRLSKRGERVLAEVDGRG